MSLVEPPEGSSPGPRSTDLPHIAKVKSYAVLDGADQAGAVAAMDRVGQYPLSITAADGTTLLLATSATTPWGRTPDHDC